MLSWSAVKLSSVIASKTFFSLLRKQAAQDRDLLNNSLINSIVALENLAKSCSQLCLNQVA